MSSYQILEAGRAIRCLRCGMTSWNLNDVKYRYCGKCKVFHDDAHVMRGVL
ncbi:ribosomal protein L37E [Paraburkholderia sp. MM6662-R1]